MSTSDMSVTDRLCGLMRPDPITRKLKLPAANAERAMVLLANEIDRLRNDLVASGQLNGTEPVKIGAPLQQIDDRSQEKNS